MDKKKFSLFFLTLITMVFGSISSASARPELGYQSHEWVFQEGATSLKLRSQTQANQICKANWDNLRGNIPAHKGDYDLFKPQVWHVWAHLQKGHCVVNHRVNVSGKSRLKTTWRVNGLVYPITLPDM